MIAFALPKGGGRWRIVHACHSHGEERRYRRLANVLAAAERQAAQAAQVEQVAHGFIRHRSPVTAAMAHTGYAVTVSVDISGWYDAVRLEQVEAGLLLAGMQPGQARSLAGRACLPALDERCPRWQEPAPRQGLASSPAAANLAAVALDRRIVDALAATGHHWCYTRYADDLTVSSHKDDRGSVDAILSILRMECEAMGWSLADHKTCIQRASAGRRIILGISVGEDIRPSRKSRRQLRAARHQNPKSPQAKGLAEWCALRVPGQGTLWRDVVKTLAGNPWKIPPMWEVTCLLERYHAMPSLVQKIRQRISTLVQVGVPHLDGELKMLRARLLRKAKAKQ